MRAIKPPAQGQEEHADTEVPGLRVRIGAGGTKTFIVRRRAGGRQLNVSLGRYCPTRFNLNDARRKARSVINDIEATGVVPRKSVPKVATSPTLRAMVPAYIAYVRDEKRNRGWTTTKRIFDQRILPELGDRLAETITRADITRMQDRIDTPGARRSAHVAISAFYS